jgi:cytochrome c oxidase assembly protein Cox11
MAVTQIRTGVIKTVWNEAIFVEFDYQAGLHVGIVWEKLSLHQMVHAHIGDIVSMAYAGDKLIHATVYRRETPV